MGNVEDITMPDSLCMQTFCPVLRKQGVVWLLQLLIHISDDDNHYCSWCCIPVHVSMLCVQTVDPVHTKQGRVWVAWLPVCSADDDGGIFAVTGAPPVFPRLSGAGHEAAISHHLCCLQKGTVIALSEGRHIVRHYCSHTPLHTDMQQLLIPVWYSCGCLVQGLNLRSVIISAVCRKILLFSSFQFCFKNADGCLMPIVNYSNKIYYSVTSYVAGLVFIILLWLVGDNYRMLYSVICIQTYDLIFVKLNQQPDAVSWIQEVCIQCLFKNVEICIHSSSIV